MSEFTDYLCDVFILFGSVTSRRMFGGHGLYFDNCMFGLVAEDTLYLKVDEQNAHHFAELDLPPFEYEKSDGLTMVMSYRMAPESIYEDQDEAAVWAAHAWEAAKRAKSAKVAKSKKTKNKKIAAKKKSTSKKNTSNKKVGKKSTNKKKTSKKKTANKKASGKVT